MLDFLFEREFNEKCLAISGAAVLAYFTLPPRRASVAAAIAVGTYVFIAYYDDLFDCDDKLRSLGGLYGALTAPLKPAVGADGRYGSDSDGDALPAATTSPADCD